MKTIQAALAPLFSAETAEDFARDFVAGLDAPFKAARVSTLGGPQHVTILFTVGADPKDKWSNGILENSRYGKFSLSPDGTVALISGHGLGKFRKHRVKHVGQLWAEFDALIESLQPKKADKTEYTRLDRLADSERDKLGRELYQDISNLIDGARVNADDTCFAEKTLPEGEWGSCFLGSLGSLLSDGVDQKVADWFSKNGVKW